MKLGERAGPGIDADEVIPALDRVIKIYVDQRKDDDESFPDTCRRIGTEPFKQALYDTAS